MIPPDDLRILIEAAFPGAVVRPWQGEWCITPTSPIEIDDLLVETINLDGRGRLCAYELVVTAAVIQSVGIPRRHIHDELERRMQSVSAHDFVAARRRLGL